MNTYDTFNINRLFKLIINDVSLQTKTIRIFAIAMLVFFLIMPFSLINNPDVYLVILYIGGFLITSSAFKDLHDPLRAHHSLMLPCSNVERFLSRWFLTSIGYAVALLVMYYIFILVHFFILLSFANFDVAYQHIKPMNIFRLDIWASIGKYIIFQSVVLLGAMMFKKYSLIKTALILGCFFLVLNIFSLLIYIMFFPHFFTDLHANIRIMTPPITINGGYFSYWLFAAPVFWYATYLKLTEYELK